MTAEELEKIAATRRAQETAFTSEIRVCMGTGCLSAHSDKILDELTRSAKVSGADKTCHLKRVGCRGLCAAGPLVTVEPNDVLYHQVTVADNGDPEERNQ
jgi:NADH:ubiquinone oxidoreductase subunit E